MEAKNILHLAMDLCLGGFPVMNIERFLSKDLRWRLQIKCSVWSIKLEDATLKYQMALNMIWRGGVVVFHWTYSHVNLGCISEATITLWTGDCCCRGKPLHQNAESCDFFMGVQWVRAITLFKIHFEKTNDQVEWPFVIAILQILVLRPHFLKAVKNLFWESSTCLFQFIFMSGRILPSVSSLVSQGHSTMVSEP